MNATHLTAESLAKLDKPALLAVAVGRGMEKKDAKKLPKGHLIHAILKLEDRVGVAPAAAPVMDDDFNVVAPAMDAPAVVLPAEAIVTEAAAQLEARVDTVLKALRKVRVADGRKIGTGHSANVDKGIIGMQAFVAEYAGSVCVSKKKADKGLLFILSTSSPLNEAEVTEIATLTKAACAAAGVVLGTIRNGMHGLIAEYK